MGNFTTFNDGEAIDCVKSQPKNCTLELIRQYARVCTPLTTIAFSQMIAN